jgi:NADPH:quinone reductase-like Zn-dependent oxidoreductase
MTTMTAAVITDGELAIRTNVPRPAPGPGQVLIAVHAAGINRADLAQRAGRYRQHATADPTAPPIAGLEVAGVVTATGSGVVGVAVGDAVMTMCWGGYAEYVAVDHRLVLPKPQRLSWAEAAATPVAFITAHNALGDIGPGQSLLVTGASSTVGMTAVQIARHRGVDPIVATAGSPDKCAALEKLGATATIDYRTADLTARLAELGGIDVVLDHVGGPWLPTLLAAMAPGGRLVTVGRLAGNSGECDLDLVARNRLHIVGVSFRTRSLAQYAEVVRAFADDLLPAVASGALTPVVADVLPLHRAAQAQQQLEDATHLGKLVLAVRE